MKIEEIVSDYNSAENFKDEQKYLPFLINYFHEQGPSNFRLKFWKMTSIEKQETFIKGLFNQIIHEETEKKLGILKILRNLFIDSPPEIKESLLSIIYAALFEKNNYKVVLSALDFFIQMYSFFSEDEKKHIFGKLLDFIQIAEIDLADEGIIAFSNIFQDLTENQRKELFEILCRIAGEKDDRLRYVSFETLELLIKGYPLEYPTKERTKIFEEIELSFKNNAKNKNVQVVLGSLRLILLFEKLFDNKLEDKIFKRILFAIKKSKGEYIREIFEVLMNYWKSLKFIPKDKALNKILPFIQDIYKQKENLEPLTYNIFNDFFNLIWNNFPEETQKKFY